MNALQRVLHKQSVKCLTALVALLFLLNSIFSLSAIAAGDLLGCNSSHTLERYNHLHKMIAERVDIVSDIDLVYNLAKVSLCLEKKDEGMSHLQRASNNGHIVATYLLGVYYTYNQTFHSSEKAKDLENINKAIHYYTNGVQMIEATSDYPRGSTDDMVYIESQSYTSYWLFTYLPILYFKGYFNTIKNVSNEKTAEIFYDDTLEVLTKMDEAATRCLARPALDAWKEKRKVIYAALQIECGALLNFAETAYLLEQQRIEADQNCTVPLSKCTEHQEVFDKIYQLAKDTFRQVNSVSIH